MLWIENLAQDLIWDLPAVDHAYVRTSTGGRPKAHVEADGDRWEPYKFALDLYRHGVIEHIAPAHAARVPSPW